MFGNKKQRKKVVLPSSASFSNSFANKSSTQNDKFNSSSNLSVPQALVKNEEDLKKESQDSAKNIQDIKNFVEKRIPLNTDETIELQVVKKLAEKKERRIKLINTHQKQYKSSLEMSDIERFSPDIETGLTKEQVEKRIKQGLVNTTRKSYTKSYGKIIANNIVTFFNILMTSIAIFLVICKLYSDLFFMIIVVSNIVIGIIQEVRAKHTIDKLKLITSPNATLIRSGNKFVAKLSDVVLDDIMVLSTGNQIGADAIVKKGTLEVNEALLTGESKPIKKNIGDRILAGSFVVSGSATVQTDSVGEYTFAGSLQSQAKKYHKPKSELGAAISNIIKVISIFVIPIGVVMGYVNYQGFIKKGFVGIEAINKAAGATAGSIIGMIPSGLVLLTSMALAVGIIRLAKRKTLVQDLYSIEMLARVNCLCLDKTGTLTDGTMRVTEVINIRNDIDLKKIMSNYLSSFEESNQTSIALGDEFTPQSDLAIEAKLDFSSSRKFSAVTFHNEGTYILGAPEFIYSGADQDLLNLIKDKEAHGFRVLMLCRSNGLIKDDNVTGKLIPQALFVLIDHIRKDAKTTIDWFKENKVEVKVISGDSPLTVSEIAKRCDVPNAENYVSLDGLSLAETALIADKYTVFGRVTPDQKATLVSALKSLGKTVAMTGDGVNDILAMKKADCSIAMANGSDATKSVAHLVLLDSNFSSMPKVVQEGRRVINNIQLSASLYLMKTMFTIMLSIIVLTVNFFGTNMTYPFTPKNLMLMEVFIIGLPSFFLALQANNRIIEGKFMKNVMVRAVPGAFCLLTAVLICIILKYANFFEVDAGTIDISFTTLCIISMDVAGLMVLGAVCYPFNIYRSILFVISAGLAFLFAFVLPSGLIGISIYSLNKIQWLIFTILSLAIPFIYFGWYRLIRKAFGNYKIKTDSQADIK